MHLRDSFFGKDHLRAIPGAIHVPATLSGDWIDTRLRGETLAFVTEVSVVAAGGTLTLTNEMADDDGSDAPDAGTIVAVPAALSVLPKHTDALPNEPPTLGSYPAVVTAVTTATAPLRWYIDPDRASGTTGLKRWVRVKAVIAVADVTFGVMAHRCRSYAGIVAP